MLRWVMTTFLYIDKVQCVIWKAELDCVNFQNNFDMQPLTVLVVLTNWNLLAEDC